MNEIRNLKTARTRCKLAVASRHSSFGLRPSFGLRVSAVGFQRPTQAFTLVEVLLALAICAIVLVAINAVFATAVRLRDKTTGRISEALPLNQALDILRRDLKSTVGPGGFLAGDFKCDSQGMGVSMGLSGESGAGGLDFFTSSAVIGPNAPWGDLQEVYYELKPPADRQQAGMELVRNVNRNLLATSGQTADTQVLLSGVQTAEFECFDGSQWRNNWDTSLGDTNLPNAVRVTIQLVAKPGEDSAAFKPLEMIVPLGSQTTRSNQLTSARNSP
jgi:type II secretion system protein J